MGYDGAFAMGVGQDNIENEICQLIFNIDTMKYEIRRRLRTLFAWRRECLYKTIDLRLMLCIKNFSFLRFSNHEIMSTTKMASALCKEFLSRCRSGTTVDFCNVLLFWIPTLMVLNVTAILPVQASSPNSEIPTNSDEIGDLFQLLRGNSALAEEDGTVWSETVGTWMTDLESGRYGKRAEGRNLEITRESLWEIWKSLPTITRDLVIKKLHPFLVPVGGDHNSDRWKLHCSDAYTLCMADSNCFWKYENYISSCTSEDSSSLRNWERAKTLHGYQRPHPDRSPTKSTRGQRRKRRSGMRKGKSRRHVLFEVEKRTKTHPRTMKHRRHSEKRKTVEWMGERVVVNRKGDVDQYLEYFSMKTRSNKCSSKCVNSLVMLNETVYGPLLAHCDCKANTLPLAYRSAGKSTEETRVLSDQIKEESRGWGESTCHNHQITAQACRPRYFHESEGVIGCTESRERCENDPVCADAQSQFLSHCSQVINGVHCTKACAESVRKLRSASKSYDTCVCDSAEGPICRQIRSNVVRLCDVKDVPIDVLEEAQVIQQSQSQATNSHYKPSDEQRNSHEINNSYGKRYSHILSDKRTLRAQNKENFPRGGANTYFHFFHNSLLITLLLIAQAFLKKVTLGDT